MTGTAPATPGTTPIVVTDMVVAENAAGATISLLANGSLPAGATRTISSDDRFEVVDGQLKPGRRARSLDYETEPFGGRP